MINSVLKKIGSWSVKVDESMPFEVLDNIEMFGHMAFVPGDINPVELGDQTLDLARYVGIVRQRSATSIGGVGLYAWLGDEDDKGEVYETVKKFTGSTFANTIRELLPAAVEEGTLYSVPGTYSGVHRYESPRKAIDYVCEKFDADWRITNRCKLDAGKPEDLFVTNPTAVIVRKGAGVDMHLAALPGEIETSVDAKDYTTKVILLAEGDGYSVATGTATIANNPYKDMHGNPVQRTRLVSESETSTGNAQARAQLQLNRFSSPKRSASLKAEEFDVEGDFEPGDWVWVYDPEGGIYDTTNPQIFRGEYIYPAKIRVLGISYPIGPEYTVAYRSPDGEWVDLSEYVVFETGKTTVDVGDNLSTALVSGAEAVRPRVTGDSTAPAVPTISSITTQSYLSGKGQTRARLTVSWNLPLNEDGSTIVDGDYYRVRWRVNGGSIYYNYTSVGWESRNVTIDGLANGTNYDVSVEAVDLAGNSSGFGPDQTVLASPDDIPPSTPAAPTVAGNPLSIQVQHNLGKATGGAFNLENDLAFLFVYAGSSSGFTPSSASYVGRIPCGMGNLEQQVPALGSFPVVDGSTKWVKVTAVDSSGNESGPSSAAQATALLIDTTHISNAAITTAKIADAQITTAKVAELHGSKITAGTINANHIASNTIASKHLTSITIETAKYIQSTSYASGSSGWRINGNGNAEFNNVTIRGTIAAARLASDVFDFLRSTGTNIAVRFQFTPGTGGSFRENRLYLGQGAVNANCYIAWNESLSQVRFNSGIANVPAWVFDGRVRFLGGAHSPASYSVGQWGAPGGYFIAGNAAGEPDPTWGVGFYWDGGSYYSTQLRGYIDSDTRRVSLYNSNGAVEQFYIDASSGNPADTRTISRTSVIVLSDAKAKSGIKRLNKARDKIRAVMPIQYKLKHRVGKNYRVSTREHIGFSAEEIKAVLPEAVHENLCFVDPKIAKPDDVGMGIDYSALIPVLWQGHREQDEEIDELRAEIVELKKELARPK